VLQKQVAENEVTIIVLVKWVLSDSKLADSFTLVEVCHRLQLENGLTDLESNWLEFLSGLLAWLVNLAESFISLAIKVLEISSPLVLKSSILLWRNSQETQASWIPNR
jgi:hypothetical protein